jgi:MYXO-CTERM domain-containing protein
MKTPRLGRLLAALAISLPTLGLSTQSYAWQGLDGPPLPIWSAIPVKYHVNRASYPANIAAVAEDRLVAGFASWSAPNCTFFDTLLVGDLPNGSADWNDGTNVVLWINKPDSWPSELGPEDSVIGVTLPIWSDDGMGHSLIDDADMIFNNVGFCWFDYDSLNPEVTCSGGKPVDTASIVTHEQGHFLGLGHSNVSGSTMEPAYLGGNELASIEQDDIDGVCALYPLGGTGSAADGATCDSCRQNAAKNECFTPAKSCTKSCLGLGDCILECQNLAANAYDACATKCTDQFNDGLVAYSAFSDCVCYVCDKPCAGQCSGPIVADSGENMCESNGSGICQAPQFTGNGGCGCVVGGRDERTGSLAMLGIFFAALARRRR